MRVITAILFFLMMGCKIKNNPNIELSDINDKNITLLEFHFEHSLRIPDYMIDIVINKRKDSINLHLTSTPMKGHPEWEYTKRDTSFRIADSVFNQLLNSVREISSKDLEYALDEGDDGESCEIRYGNYQNWISYLVWTPGYNSKERKTKDFLEACRQIIKAAKLDPNKIL